MIPTEIFVSAEQSLPVVQIDRLDSLGQFDQRSLEIRIRQNQPEAAKVLILMHEMLHVCENMLMERGILGLPYRLLRRWIGEQFVENMSSCLFQLMAQSGMLTGCSADDARQWIAEQFESGNAGT